MDRLWSPWRYQYVTAGKGSRACVFCQMAAESADQHNLIVHRGDLNFILLNLFPYTNGHLMIAPYEHVASLQQARPETLAEMMGLARKAEAVLHQVYNPGGINLGMNLGESAGAGVAGHIHLHLLPRWSGDANFMTTVAETRVMPEQLSVTWEKLRAAW